MGRLDSSDEEYERRKKKSYRRSRSRSKSVDSRASRKSKHKKHSSHSRRRRSRSRSRSKGRPYSRRSRSYSRDRRRSKSRDRYRSRERSYDYRRSRSRSHSGRRRRRSRSDSRRRDSPGHSSAASRDHSSSRSLTEGISKSLADMTPSEQNQARMQLAIEKAKAADEAIRLRHGVADDEPADTKGRQQALKSIESEGFTQQTFSSSRHSTEQSKKKASEFVFGTSIDYVKSTNSESSSDYDSLMHSRFFEDEVERKDRWIKVLKNMRYKILAS